MNWIKECKYDKATECVLIELYFECAPPGCQNISFALGINETNDLIKALQKSIEGNEINK